MREIGAANELISLRDGDSGDNVMSPLQFPSPTLPIHPRDPPIPDALDVNPYLDEFREIEDLLSNLRDKGAPERRRRVLVAVATRKEALKTKTSVTLVGITSLFFFFFFFF